MTEIATSTPLFLNAFEGFDVLNAIENLLSRRGKYRASIGNRQYEREY